MYIQFAQTKVLDRLGRPSHVARVRSLAPSAIGLLAVIVISSHATLSHASQNGRDGFSGNPQTNSGATCLVCHNASSQSAELSISGPATVNANGTYDYVATLIGGAARTGGIGISVEEFDGDLQTADGSLRRLSNDLSHTVPKSFSNSQVQFRFRWKAPSYNVSTTIFAAANSSSGNLDLNDDAIAATNFPVRVQNGSGTRPDTVPPPTAAIKLQQVASGLSAPVALANAGDERLFIVERTGLIKILDGNGAVLAQPFLDLTTKIDSWGSEQGLLGLAFHPGYSSNGYFYVNFTRDLGANVHRTRVSRFRVSGNRNIADAASETVLMEFDQPYENHNGGDLKFGKDGFLYIASGDGGSGGDPRNFAQNPNSVLGKILRIDVNGSPGPANGPDCNLSGTRNYRIPPDNTFNNGTGNGCDEIFALGLRNPWRISFDRQTGDLWIGDVGQNSVEEIDRLKAGSGAGANFGWRCFEGNSGYNNAGCNGQYLPSTQDMRHTEGFCSVTGGFVYRGSLYPELYGRYIFSDFCKPSIYTLSEQAGGWVRQTALLNSNIGTPTAFAEDARGELYLAAYTGRIYRVTGNGVGGTSQFSVSGATVTEGPDVIARVGVTLSPAATGPTSVQLNSLQGSATPGEDYTGFSRILNFATGETAKSVDIRILNDNIDENQESFDVRLRRGQGAAIAKAEAEVRIDDDDSITELPIVSTRSLTVMEDDGYAQVSVRLSKATTSQVSMRIATGTGSAATGQDYFGFSGDLIFAAGEVTKTVQIELLDDTLNENDEHFTVRIYKVAGAKLGSDIATVTIKDNDQPSAGPEVSIFPATVGEGDGQVTVSVQLSEPSSQTVEVLYSSFHTDGARPGADFYGVYDTLSFSPFETSKTIRIDIIDDEILEGSETFSLRLFDASNATISSDTTTVTINDNDSGGGELALTVFPRRVDEHAGMIDVWVSLSEAATAPVLVEYSSRADSAATGVDYFGVYGQLRFAAGEKAKVIKVEILDDTETELNEDFYVRLFNPVGASLAVEEAKLTIADND